MFPRLSSFTWCCVALESSHTSTAGRKCAVFHYLLVPNRSLSSETSWKFRHLPLVKHLMRWAKHIVRPGLSVSLEYPTHNSPESDVIYLEALGMKMLALNSYQTAKELLETKNFSSRCDMQDAASSTDPCPQGLSNLSCATLILWQWGIGISDSSRTVSILHAQPKFINLNVLLSR